MNLLTINKIDYRIKFNKIWIGIKIMRNKIKILCYECKKCNKTVYFRSNEEYTTQCKTCKNEMQFICEHNYNPKNGLSAINASNIKPKNSNIPKPVKPVVKCLYCGSENVRKISGTERTISVLTLGFLSNKINKSFKCNDCGGTF